MLTCTPPVAAVGGAVIVAVPEASLMAELREATPDVKLAMSEERLESMPVAVASELAPPSSDEA